jgi:hypothetical protein
MRQGTVLGVLTLSLACATAAMARQDLPPGFNERRLHRDESRTPEDRDRKDIWVLNFHFKEHLVPVVSGLRRQGAAEPVHPHLRVGQS